MVYARILLLSAATWSVLGAGRADATVPPTSCDKDNPQHCARPMQAGEPAPWSGQLLTMELAIDLSLKADFCNERIELAVEAAENRWFVKYNLAEELSGIRLDAAKQSIKALQAALAEAGPPWYHEPWIVATLSVVVTVVVMSAAIRGANLLAP